MKKKMLSIGFTFLLLISSATSVFSAICSYTVSAGSTTINIVYGTAGGDCCSSFTGVAIVAVYEGDRLVDEYYSSAVIPDVQSVLGC